MKFFAKLRESKFLVLMICGTLVFAGCATLSENMGGAGIGAAVGGGIGYIIGEEKGAAIGVVLGGLIGANIQKWRKTKARTISEEQTMTQAQVNAMYDIPDPPAETIDTGSSNDSKSVVVASNFYPRPEPTIRVQPAQSILDPNLPVLTSGKDVVCAVSYNIVGVEGKTISVCRYDSLSYKDTGEKDFAKLVDLYDQCDLTSSGQNVHKSGFAIPEGALEGIYRVESTVAIKQGSSILSKAVYGFYFAVGENFEAEVPTSGLISGSTGPTPGASYTVMPGDTLGGIATKTGVSTRSLMDANGISNPNLLQAGQVLTIPNAN